MKSEERDYMCGQLKPEVYLPPQLNMVRECWMEVEEFSRKAVLNVNEGGEWLIGNSVWKREYEEVVELLPMIYSRIVLLEENRLLIERRKKAQKGQEKKVADVEMGYVKMSAKVVSDIVEVKVAAAMKKLTIAVDVDLESCGLK